MGQLFTVFNNKSSLDFDLIAHIPEITPSMERYNNNENNYRDSIAYIDCNSRTEIIIAQEFEFIEYDLDKWQDRFREIKKWLLKIKNNELQFSDDINYFYLVNKVEIDTPSREGIRNCKFKVTFHCDSYVYLYIGKNRIELPNVLNNEYEIAYPSYRIEGEGLCTININGNTIKINVGGNVNIDTKNRKCYKDDGSNVNTSMSGKYTDMRLIEGDNTFIYTSGFKVYITPNWRCL